MSYNNPYSSKTSSPKPVSAAKRSFLKDSSWIKNDGDDGDDSVFQPNQLTRKSGSVSNLTKRFGGSQDLDQSSKQTSTKTVTTSHPGGKTTTTTTTTETKTVTPTKPALATKPPSSPAGKSNFTDRVFANKPDPKYSSPQSPTTTVSRKTTYTETTNGSDPKYSSPQSPTTTVSRKTTYTETTNGVNSKTISPASPVSTKSRVESTPKSPTPVPSTRSSFKSRSSGLESPSPTHSGSKSPSYKPSTLDNLADTLIDIPTKPADSTTAKTRTSITRRESEVDSIPARHLDSLADTLDPFSSSTPPPEKTRNSSSYDSYSSPTKSVPDTSYSRSTKYSAGETIISPKTSPSVQTLSKRSVSDRNMCSFCHQPITESIRMVLDELKICSHADCFKCVGCHCKLSNLEAGDSLWVYRDAVNCDNCYLKIKDRWYH
ncbi:mucin-2-like isoform X2 [Sardina pilchardus]|uniref:mucin-2-like isoform X2 n=1 Tax=Sardina pilchardus TaxID=27697 RepID=UPI002E0E22F7